MHQKAWCSPRHNLLSSPLAMILLTSTCGKGVGLPSRHPTQAVLLHQSALHAPPAVRTPHVLLQLAVPAHHACSSIQPGQPLIAPALQRQSLEITHCSACCKSPIVQWRQQLLGQTDSKPKTAVGVCMSKQRWRAARSMHSHADRRADRRAP